MHLPTRIVCLTEETTETLYLLGEEHRIVGISGYTVRPPQARKDKPRVAAFTSAQIPKILALNPDLVLAFSDLQADIVAALIRAGIAVHAFNQRTVAGILAMVRTLGALVGAEARANALVDSLVANVESVRQRSAHHAARPKVYFEEWNDPMISGIHWVSELVSIAGGDDIFAGRAHGQSASERIVMPDDVIRHAPDILIGSWCGRKFRPDEVAARVGFDAVPAVQNHELHEIKSALILQPGPAALTDGLAALEVIIATWVKTGEY